MVRAILVALSATTLVVGGVSGQTAPRRPLYSTAFAAFIAPEVIFFGEKSVMRGKGCP